MKVQYFGDINDYRKFALLRLLSEVGQFKIGVCWMLTAGDDGSGHGANRGYVGQPGVWRSYDPVLFDALVKVPATPTLNDLHRVEDEALIPGAIFFEDCVPDTLSEREAYHKACMSALRGSELIVLDPDTGLEVKSKAKGRKRSSKYVYDSEIDDHYRAGRSALIYQHFPMNVTHEACIANAANRLAARLTGASIWSIVTAHVVFLLAVRPEHDARAAAVVETLSARVWLPHFVKSARRCELSAATKAGTVG